MTLAFRDGDGEAVVGEHNSLGENDIGCRRHIVAHVGEQRATGATCQDYLPYAVYLGPTDSHALSPIYQQGPPNII